MQKDILESLAILRCILRYYALGYTSSGILNSTAAWVVKCSKGISWQFHPRPVGGNNMVTVEALTITTAIYCTCLFSQLKHNCKIKMIQEQKDESNFTSTTLHTHCSHRHTHSTYRHLL